jgi:hypothetical protein
MPTIMEDKIKKLCENYALRIYELEDVIPNLGELGDAVGSAEAEAEMLCLMNVVRELGGLIEEEPKEIIDKVITYELLYELLCNEAIEYDVLFTYKDVKYKFIFDAYDDAIKEYRRDNVMDLMDNMNHMVGNGIYELVKD